MCSIASLTISDSLLIRYDRFMGCRLYENYVQRAVISYAQCVLFSNRISKTQQLRIQLS